MDQVTLISVEGEKLTISRNSAVKNSKYFETILESSESGEIVLEYEKSIVELVVLYLTIHENNEPNPINKPLKSSDLSQAGVSQEDIEFLSKQKNISEAMTLLNAAGFLMINGLINLLSAQIATTFLNQSPQDLIKKYEILDVIQEADLPKVEENTKWMTLSH